MKYQYVDEKTIRILPEEGLEEWFWKSMYHAIVNGDIKLKKLKRKFYDEDEKKQNKYLVIEIKRTK